MAKKDIVDLNGAKAVGVNLDFRVGSGGENRPSDVMLIQTLFRYIGRIPDLNKRFLGDIRLPKIDGICGVETMRAISHFQHKNARRLLRIDGLIHPASYGGRVVKDAQKPIMAIMLLHFYAFDALYSSLESAADPHYIPALIRMEPQLGHFLS